MTLENLSIKKIKEPVWCDKCGYNLILVNGECLNCDKIKQNLYDETKYSSEEQKKANVIAKIGGYRAYQKYTAENFNDKKILEQLKDFPKINIFISGAVGTGKTHLGTTLIRNCSNFCKYTSIELCREFRKTFSSKNSAEAESDLIDKLCNTPLLIDDFGAEKKTESKVENIYEIINKRYELGNGGLIITSNFELGKSRISSRLFEMCKIIKLDGRDFRLNKEHK